MGGNFLQGEETGVSTLSVRLSLPQHPQTLSSYTHMARNPAKSYTLASSV